MNQLNRLGSSGLGALIAVSLLYGVLSDPHGGGIFYTLQWMVKTGAIIFSILGSFWYINVASKEDAPVFQWPAKFVISSLAGFIAACVFWALLWFFYSLVEFGKSLSSSVGIMLGLGIIAAIVFYSVWGFLEEEINNRKSRNTLYAAGVAVLVQVILAAWGYLLIAKPDAFSDIAATAIGPAVVGVVFGTILAPPAIGLLAFQLAIFAFWLKRRIARRSLPLSSLES